MLLRRRAETPVNHSDLQPSEPRFQEESERLLPLYLEYHHNLVDQLTVLPRWVHPNLEGFHLRTLEVPLGTLRVLEVAMGWVPQNSCALPLRLSPTGLSPY